MNPGRDTVTPRNVAQNNFFEEQAFKPDIASQKLADMSREPAFSTSGAAFDSDLYKTGAQLPRPCSHYSHASLELHLPTNFDKYMGLDRNETTKGDQAYSLAAWHSEEHQIQPTVGDKAAWPYKRNPSEPPTGPIAAVRTDSKISMHQRLPSSSSGIYGEERQVPASEPGSDLSSDYSDPFQVSGLPFPPIYPSESGQETPPSFAYIEPQHRPLPDYVMEELKRLKLENMALRRMAQEVVRINISPGSLEGQNLDRPAPFCAHHPPLTSPPRLQRVYDGADPVQVYHEASRPNASALSCSARGGERGTAASVWAQSSRNIDSFSQREASTPASSVANQPFRASDISAAELSRRVAMAETCSTPLAGSHTLTGTISPFDIVSAPASLPGHVRSKASLTGTSYRNSPGLTPLAPSKLESTPASTLVGTILDKRGQEASLLLQQQLKNGSRERQEEIFQVICARLVALSHDRHGNFLVQSAIEARPEMVMHLGGAFVELTMSQFGCHVVQKALECEENVGQAVTEELLGSRLDQTLTSRHSIHVWQRILETEWKEPQFREQIFASINKQLKGQWARTARQETGSIICQNIFESAQSTEKAECMQEVLEQLDECATNQWGVWVVQHMIEHGAQEERRAVLSRLVRSACKLTLSQYGQKAVMSALKTGDGQFLQDYVEAMCHSSQPRRPGLIDVCLAAHGIQVVTQLLTTVDQKTRERIISTVRRNSVLLKGSRAGMKVHQLCERARAFTGY
ncbi:hypothetical protein NDA17_001671 [Ustilago hordei]|nr:hypothetical protein NDA17_001671 [Ustilago hordei]